MVVRELAATVAVNARDRESHFAFALFRIEDQPKVLVTQLDDVVIAPSGIIANGPRTRAEIVTDRSKIEVARSLLRSAGTEEPRA